MSPSQRLPLDRPVSPLRKSRAMGQELQRHLTAAPLGVSRDRVAAVLGSPSDAGISPRLRKQIDQAASELAERVQPGVAHQAYPVRVEPGRVHVNGRTTLCSGKLAFALDPCRTIHVYVVTLGRPVDLFIAQAMRDRPHFGVVADAAASVAAETLVDRLEGKLSAQLPTWAALSLPFSPGHCDWPVEEQQKLFSLLPQRPAGVLLSEDGMMKPRKTISGVMGVGPVEAVTAFRNPCSACARAECTHRR